MKSQEDFRPIQKNVASKCNLLFYPIIFNTDTSLVELPLVQPP